MMVHNRELFRNWKMSRKPRLLLRNLEQLLVHKSTTGAELFRRNLVCHHFCGCGDPRRWRWCHFLPRGCLCSSAVRSRPPSRRSAVMGFRRRGFSDDQFARINFFFLRPSVPPLPPPPIPQIPFILPRLLSSSFSSSPLLLHSHR